MCVGALVREKLKGALKNTLQTSQFDNAVKNSTWREYFSILRRTQHSASSLSPRYETSSGCVCIVNVSSEKSRGKNTPTLSLSLSGYESRSSLSQGRLRWAPLGAWPLLLPLLCHHSSSRWWRGIGWCGSRPSKNSATM